MNQRMSVHIRVKQEHWNELKGLAQNIADLVKDEFADIAVFIIDVEGDV